MRRHYHGIPPPCHAKEMAVGCIRGILPTIETCRRQETRIEHSIRQVYDITTIRIMKGRHFSVAEYGIELGKAAAEILVLS